MGVVVTSVAPAPASASTIAAVSVHEQGEVIVVTVRHPDFENETTVFGADKVRVIDLDLGRSFDTRSASARDYDTVAGWAASHYQSVADLAADAPARLFVEEQARKVFGRAGRYEAASDGQRGWEVYDWAEQQRLVEGLDYDAAAERVSSLESARDLDGEIRLEIARNG